MMRAVRLHDARDIRFEKVDSLPDPAPGEVRMRVAFAGICGSDIHNFKTGQWITRRPSTAGHEFAGIIESVGVGVTGLEPGDKAIADSRDYCGACEKCRSNKHHLCENLGFIGESRDGGFADFVDLPQGLVFKCAADAPLDVMALAEPLAVALHALAKMQADDRPLFIAGCGPIGALSAIASKLTSQRELFLCDLNAARANLVADITDGQCVSLPDLQGLANRPTDPVTQILDTSGSTTVISAVLKVLSGGTLGLVGIGSGTLDFDPVHIVEREISVIGCHAFSDELPQAIDLLQKNQLIFKPILQHRIQLEDVPREFEKIAGGGASGIKTLIEIGGD